MIGTVGKILLAYLGFFAWVELRAGGSQTKIPSTKVCFNSTGGFGCAHCFQQPSEEQLSVSMNEPGKLISIPKCKSYRGTSCGEMLQLINIQPNKTVNVDPLNQVQLYLQALKAQVTEVPRSYNLTGQYQWVVFTYSPSEISVSYRQSDILPQLKMYRELVGWSALLLGFGLLYKRNSITSAVSLFSLSIAVMYLFDIYEFEPEIKHLTFYSSMASAAFIYVVLRQVPINNIVATLLMVLSLAVDYIRSSGLASDAVLLLFVVVLTFTTIVISLINMDKLNKRSVIALTGLILFQFINVAGALFLKSPTLVNGIAYALALNVTPLLLLAYREKNKRAEAKASGRPYRPPRAEQQMEEVEDVQQEEEQIDSADQQEPVETEESLSVQQKKTAARQ